MMRQYVLAAVIAAHLSAACSITPNSGTEYIVRLETDRPDRTEMMERAVTSIENRMRAVGLDGDAERLPDSPDSIRVKVYGEQDPAPIKRYLFSTPRLELRAAVSELHPSPLRMYATEETARAAATAGQEVMPYSANPFRTENLLFIIVEKVPVITGEDVRTAYAASRTDIDHEINFTVKDDGAAKFADWTSNHIGHYLAVVLDGQVRSYAHISSPISDMGVITGNFSKEEAESLARVLNSGYLPVTLTVTDERKFGN
jgi:preprotein translocase subunit SecD